MKENELKQRIQKSVKENIAISNWKEEIHMNKEKNRKLVCGVLASCAMLVLAIGIITTKQQFSQN